MIHHGPDLITRFRFFGHSNNVRRALRKALSPLRQIYEPLSDTMLTWVNNAGAKQEYRSSLSRHFELCAGVAICVQIVRGRTQKCQKSRLDPSTKPSSKPQRPLSYKSWLVGFSSQTGCSVFAATCSEWSTRSRSVNIFFLILLDAKLFLKHERSALYRSRAVYALPSHSECMRRRATRKTLG
jgi:hypothetical protein